MFVFTLKCTTAATEETEVKIHDVVVNCKPMRPQVLPVSNTGFQLWLFHEEQCNF